jgi:hypothetical protein
LSETMEPGGGAGAVKRGTCGVKPIVPGCCARRQGQSRRCASLAAKTAAVARPIEDCILRALIGHEATNY